jgi:hypothetical protein
MIVKCIFSALFAALLGLFILGGTLGGIFGNPTLGSWSLLELTVFGGPIGIFVLTFRWAFREFEGGHVMHHNRLRLLRMKTYDLEWYCHTCDTRFIPHSPNHEVPAL